MKNMKMYTLWKNCTINSMVSVHLIFESRSMAAYPEVVIQIHKLGLHPLLHQTQTEGRNVDIMLQ